MKIVCDISFFYLDKIDPKGSIAVECGRLMLRNGYKVKIFNSINFKKSMHYNPFAYIHYEAPEEEQNFATLIEFINAMEVREDDETLRALKPPTERTSSISPSATCPSDSIR